MPLEPLQILTVLLVMLGTAPALAHALELPGKMRLHQGEYVAVQSIYYPGFTVAGGIGEFGGMLATLVLLVLTPPRSAAFWLTAAALAGLLAMHAIYWTLTHPVNKFWLEGQQLGSFGARFFSFGAKKGSSEPSASRPAWTQLRNRWEYSHVVRAALSFASLAALVIATAVS